MIQAGRELDTKVAEALGWGVPIKEVRPHNQAVYWKDFILGTLLPHFSTTWEGMGVLVEEARKQGFRFKIDMYGSYTVATVGIDVGGLIKFVAGDHQITAPHAVCTAFLKAKMIAI